MTINTLPANSTSRFSFNRNSTFNAWASGIIASAIDLGTINNFCIYIKNQRQLNRPLNYQLLEETLKYGYRGFGLHWIQFGLAGGFSFALETQTRSIYRQYYDESFLSKSVIRCCSGVTVAALWNTPMENLALKKQLTGDSTITTVRMIFRDNYHNIVSNVFRGIEPIIVRQAIVMPFLLAGRDISNQLPDGYNSSILANAVMSFLVGGIGGILSAPVDTIRVHMQSQNQSLSTVFINSNLHYFKGASFRFFMIGYSSIVVNTVREVMGVE